MNFEKKVQVGIIGEPNFISLNLLENLLSKNCYITIVTDNVYTWNNLSSRINLRTRFRVLNNKDFKQTQNFDYLIYCDGFISKEGVTQKFEKFLQLNKSLKAKTLAILPFETRNRDGRLSDYLNDNLSIVYLGDVIGPRINLESDLLIVNTLKQIFFNRKLSLPIGETIYPVFITDVVRVLSKWLFSFGPYGKETLLIGPNVSASSFWKENQKIVKDLKIEYLENIPQRILPRNCEIVTIGCNIHPSLVETYRWIMQEAKSGKVRPKTQRSSFSKPVKTLILTILPILALPFLLIAIGGGLLFISYKNYTKLSENSFQSIVLASKPLFVMARAESAVLEKIPLLNLIYREVSYVASLGENGSGILSNAVPMARSGKELFDKSLGNDIYNPTDISLKVLKNIDSSYKTIASIQIETSEALSKNSLIAKKVNNTLDLSKINTLLIQGKTLLSRLPTLLGNDKQKTYLVLFQNNMELRPTGGFIGSYGLATFDKGRLSDLTVNDVYSADGQLNGHVEPPLPIKNYLGEANWWLRDSNWDPDFPTSGRRAEWFLDKEVGRQVDGVIALDLEPIKEILKYTGPIFLPDYNLDVTSDNLYEKTQAEVEQNFFPGTHKKASFLTALSQSLLSEIEKLDERKKIEVMKILYKSLESRHLQVYLHDNPSASALAILGWDGAVNSKECGSSCYADFVGLIEANVGVNKVNYFIQRQVNLDVNLTPGEVNRKLTLKITNIANQDLGKSGVYKDYVRLMVPTGAEIVDTNVQLGQSSQRVYPDIATLKGRQEVGLFVEVIPGQTKELVFEWKDKVDLKSTDKYGLYVRKQAGVNNDPWVINLRSDKPMIKDSRFILTKEGVYQYNATLVGDLLSLFSFK